MTEKDLYETNVSWSKSILVRLSVHAFGWFCKHHVFRGLVHCFDSLNTMAGIELLSDQGFRTDGRRPHELRKIQCRMGVFRQADGSAYIEQGNTKALATVYGPHEVSLLS